MNCSHKSAQDLTELGGRFISHDRVFGFGTMANQFAITFSSPPAAWTTVEYTWRNSTGWVVPSYLTGTSGLNLPGHAT